LSYIDEIADEIRRQIPAELIPEGDVAPLFRIYALLVLAKGERVVLEDVHDGWAAWMSDQDPSHHALRPLAQLPAEAQRSELPYLDAIRTVARERNAVR